MPIFLSPMKWLGNGISRATRPEERFTGVPLPEDDPPSVRGSRNAHSYVSDVQLCISNA
jgi:hypothetical protein